jgi:leucyl aminopeptidase
MNIVVLAMPPLQQATPCLIIPVWQTACETPLLKELDTRLAGDLSLALQTGAFMGRTGEKLLLHAGRRLPAERVLLVGLGEAKPAGEALRKGAALAVAVLREQRLTDCCLVVPETAPEETGDAARALAEGLLLADYRFDRFLTENLDRLPPTLKEVGLLIAETGRQDAATEGARRAQIVCRSVTMARDLVNQPGNIKSPEYMATQAAEMATAAGLKCMVLDRAQLKTEGCGALLAVGQGSVREPRLIVLEYLGGNPGEKPLALVGKAVVFDSGGLSLKPGEKMDEMKSDMAGGAAVLGTMAAAAGLKLPVNLIGIIPAVENLPSGTAYRPGDILTSLSGKTIEVLNTDAEGRLILADALTYAARFAPRAVIDLATLTGACIIALGNHTTAVLGTDQALIDRLRQAGEETGERLWQLPLWEEYDEQIKSEVADVKNTGGRPAGTITAAAFLRKFVPEGCPWAHLDIAGPSWEEKGGGYLPLGATGVGVRLLIRYLEAGG